MLTRTPPTPVDIVDRAYAFLRLTPTTLLWTWLFTFSAAGQTGPAANTTPTQSIPSSWKADAELKDVCFVDADYGWAVGDHGVIWHTQNGGEIWRQQESKITHPLSTVSFVDRQTGWAAGGEVTPLTHRSKAVLLHTVDGGKTWDEVTGLLLPSITRISFVDSKQGYAAGMSSPLHPTGAWMTKDGGRTWSPLQGVTGEHWCDASFRGGSGLLVSRSGQRAWLSSGRISNAGKRMDSGRNENYCVLLGSQTGISGPGVPQGSVDRGNAWHEITGLRLSDLKLSTITSFENHIWAAGSPGSRVLRSPDLGKTWYASNAPTPLPIQQLSFIDHNNGWAVGACGSILSSDDGGVTWKAQRGSAKRMAILAVVADERQIPWEVLAQASAEREFRVHIVVITSRGPQNPLRCELSSRLREAAMRIGATADMLCQLPYPDDIDPSATELLSAWKTIAPDCLEELSRSLTRLIRVYRPDVVLTSELPLAHNELTGAQQLTTHLLSDACDYAAAPHVFASEITQLGLQPWTVARQLAVRPSNRVASARTRSTPLGVSVKDLARTAQRLVTDQNVSSTDWSLFTIADGKKSMNVGRYAMGGSSADYGSAQRRPRTIQRNGVATQQEHIKRQLQARRIAAAEKIVGRGAQRLEQIDRLLASDPAAKADTLFQLALHEINSGDLTEADLILRRLVTRHGADGLADKALHWLVAHHASVEEAWRNHRRNLPEFHTDDKVILASATSELPASVATPAGEDSAEPPRVHLTTAYQPDWSIALKLAREIKTKRPDLYGEPEILFPIAAASRLDGQVTSATGMLRRQTSLPETTWWRGRALHELGIIGKSEAQLWRCGRAQEAPHLDGLLDDSCWTETSSRHLDNARGLDPTQVFLTRDDRHLYLAATCPKRAATSYLPKRRPRPRDADLSKMDRIQLLFDVNRDYTTWWTLEIDHRGWTTDSLMGDQSWNPKYYVASDSDSQSWRIEVAIPLEELAPPELRFQPWAVGIRRLVPGRFAERWRQAGTKVPTPDLQGVVSLE